MIIPITVRNMFECLPNDDTTEIHEINKCSQTSTMNGNWRIFRNKSTNILKGYIDGKNTSK